MDNFIAWVQSRLTSHGFAVGEIDGKFGEATLLALKIFQTSRRIPVTGKADTETVAALRATSVAVPDVVKAQIPDRDVAVSSTPVVVAGEARSKVWPRQADCTAFYGAVGTSQTAIDIPYDMCLAWDRSQRVRKMTLHKKVADSALRVLQEVATLYSPADRVSLGLNIFGGSLNVRKMRGGSSWSMHSWGIAIDFDPERNQLPWHRPLTRLSHADAAPFWAAWEREGWLSLGRARDFDWMHIQAARL